jgi:hypothetical protein
MTSIALNHVNHSLTSSAERSIDSTVSFDGPLSGGSLLERSLTMTSIALNRVNHSLASIAEGSIDSTVSFDGPLSDFLVDDGRDDGQRLSDSFGGSLLERSLTMNSIALNRVNHSLASSAEGSIDSTVSFDGPLSDFLVDDGRDDGQRLSDSFEGSLRVLSDTFDSEFFDDEVAGILDQDLLLNYDLHPRASEENVAAHVQEQERQMYHQQRQQLHQLEHQLKLHQLKLQQHLHLLKQRQLEQEQTHHQQQEQQQQHQAQQLAQQQAQQHTRHQKKYHRIQPLDKLSAQVDSNDSNEDALYPPWEKFKVLKNVRKCWESGESDRIANPVPMKKIKLDGSKNISRGTGSPNTTNFTTANDDHNTSPFRKLEFNPPSSSSSSASVGSDSESNTDSSKSNNSAKLEVKSFWLSCCGYWGGRKSGHETEKDTFLTPSASACQLGDMTAGLKQEYNLNTR